MSPCVWPRLAGKDPIGMEPSDGWEWMDRLLGHVMVESTAPPFGQGGRGEKGVATTVGGNDHLEI